MVRAERHRSVMNRLERTLILTAALVVLGGVAALPSVVSEFPVNLLALVLPAAVCLLVPAVHQTDDRSPNMLQLIAEASAPWTGFAIAFHSYHGVWDYQGIGIGALGAAVLSAIVIALTRRGRKNAASNGRSNSFRIAVRAAGPAILGSRRGQTERSGTVF
jgi:hypothetical protein